MGANEPRDRAPVRVVVVDDDPDIRLIVATFVRADARFELTGQAADGIEAVRVVERTRPDVVILDLRMPRRDGIRTIPYLRQVCPPIGIVIYSADETQTGSALDVGADMWHTKGEPLSVLLDAVALVGTVAQVDDTGAGPSRFGQEVGW